jgi:hypothetical protein
MALLLLDLTRSVPTTDRGDLWSQGGRTCQTAAESSSGESIAGTRTSCPWVRDPLRRTWSGLLKAARPSRRGDRTWIAADLTIDPTEQYLTGVLGFSVVEQVRQFEDGLFSWIKGETTEAEGALNETTVPFAVDLRDARRWVGFSPSARIRPAGFANGFQAVLNEAVRALELWPTDWEVDLLTSKTTVRAWVNVHPQVFRFVRRIRFSNPGLNLDGDRQQMRQLRADLKEERFRAPRGGTLRIEDNEVFEEMIEGIETGDVWIDLSAREPGRIAKFVSSDQVDESTISDFTGDVQTGMELVLEAVKGYSAQQAARGHA